MTDALVNGLAGAGGGVIAQILTYPLQSVNTRQQTQRKAKSPAIPVSDRASTLLDNAKPVTSLGTFQEMYKVIKEEGWGGLYRGLTPALVGTAASQGVYYYFYQLFRNRAEVIALRRKKKGAGDGTVGLVSSLVVAALAGCLNVLLTNPIWVVVTRMQTHSPVQKSTSIHANSGKDKDVSHSQSFDDSGGLSSTGNLDLVAPLQPYGSGLAVHELYNEAGLMGFWKGVLPTLIMVSNPSIQFMLYESMLKKLISKRSRKQPWLKGVSATEVFMLGAIAKLGATVATYPLLVVKSRLQAKQEIGDNALQYTGTLDAIVKMIRFEGVTGFYKGMSTKIVQSVFSAAVLFMIKEELVKAARVLVAEKGKVVGKAKVK